jgi:glucose/arabinose dehydrogenase
MKTTSDSTVLVQGMTNTDHSTRTLLISAKVPGMMLVSRGSSENIDPIAEDIDSGHSQIRAFNISDTASLPYTYNSTGTRIGWGLRNSVGVAEHPVTGGIYSVENNADDVTRNGIDFHTDNPGEEMNYHLPLASYFNGTNNTILGANFGYPICFAAWNVSEIPDGTGLSVGEQFTIGNITATNNDSLCANKYEPPRLTFPAHWAPLDIVFNTAGSVAYITSHGSW